MSEIVRLYKYKDLLLGKRAVPRQELMNRLEISEATFKRDLAKLRDQLHVPIDFDRDQGGYLMRQGHIDAELPGLWFSPEEGGCTEFCVNGQMAGNRRTSRSGYDRKYKESSAQRPHRQFVG